MYLFAICRLCLSVIADAFERLPVVCPSSVLSSCCKALITLHSNDYCSAISLRVWQRTDNVREVVGDAGCVLGIGEDFAVIQGDVQGGIFAVKIVLQAV